MAAARRESECEDWCQIASYVFQTVHNPRMWTCRVVEAHCRASRFFMYRCINLRGRSVCNTYFILLLQILMPDVKMYCITPFSSKYDGLNAQDLGCLRLLVQISSLSFLKLFQIWYFLRSGYPSECFSYLFPDVWGDHSVALYSICWWNWARILGGGWKKTPKSTKCDENLETVLKL